MYSVTSSLNIIKGDQVTYLDQDLDIGQSLYKLFSTLVEKWVTYPEMSGLFRN